MTVIDSICFSLIFIFSLFALCFFFVYLEYSERKRLNEGYSDKLLELRKKQFAFEHEKKIAILKEKLEKKKIKLLRKLSSSDLVDIDDDFGDYS